MRICPATGIEVRSFSSPLFLDLCKALAHGSDFEALAKEFVKPTKNDLVDYAREGSSYRRNIFHPVFLRLSEAAKPINYAKASHCAMSSLFEVLVSSLEDMRLSV